MLGYKKRPDFSGYESAVRTMVKVPGGIEVCLEYPSLESFERAYKRAKGGENQQPASLDNFKPGYERCVTAHMAMTSGAVLQIEFPGILAFKQGFVPAQGEDETSSPQASATAGLSEDEDMEKLAALPGKNPNRVEGGKRAAEKRSHEDFVEMGRKGGKARAEHYSQDGGSDAESDGSPEMESHSAAHSKTRESGDKPENKTADGKNPNRVEGGKRAAEKQGHDKLSENGKKGGHSTEAYRAAHEQSAGN